LVRVLFIDTKPIKFQVSPKSARLMWTSASSHTSPSAWIAAVALLAAAAALLAGFLVLETRAEAPLACQASKRRPAWWPAFSKGRGWRAAVRLLAPSREAAYGWMS
jgi:hypothetical protein